MMRTESKVIYDRIMKLACVLRRKRERERERERAREREREREREMCVVT